MHRILAGLIAVVGITRAGAAQVRVELEPVIGVYSAFASWPKPAGPFFDPADTLSQHTAATFGGQATAWLGRIGLRGSLLTSSSKVGSTGQNVIRQPVSAHVTTAGVEALVPLAEVSTGARLLVSGGAAFIHRSGDAYEDFEGTDDVGGTVGLGWHYPVSERFSLQADVRGLLYQLRLTDPSGIEYSSAFQTDVQAYVGVSVGLSPEED